MRSTPHEQERLLIHVAADVAQRRRARGLRLNLPEATALITVAVLEGARDGRSVNDLMAAGREVLGAEDVLDGVPDMLTEVQVEATFPDGTKLVTVHDPIPKATETSVRPGEVLTGGEPVVINAGVDVLELTVTNTADRPIQVGSHYHFAEANPGLEFDRTAARGRRLDVPAGTSERFEPGVSRTVRLVRIGGRRIVAGLRAETGGPLDD